MPQDHPPLSGEDLFRIRFVGSPAVSPDGALIAYTVKVADLEGNRYATHLHLVPTKGGASRQLTFGKQSDTQPTWSPDGKTLAFVSNRENKRAQIHLLPLGGGEARRLTNLDGSIMDLAWSPDGSRIAFSYSPLSEEEKARREAEKKDEADQRAAFKVFRTMHFKEDGSGYLFDAHTHVWVVEVGTGEARQITDGDTDDHGPVFSPDGKTLAFASNRLPEPLYELDNIDICTVPVQGGEIRRLTPEYGPAASPSWSPDGKTIAYLGHVCPNKGESFWRDVKVWRVPAAGGEPTLLTPGLATTAGNVTASDTADIGGGWEAPIWSPDGKRIYFLLSERGSTRVGRVAADGGEVEMLTPPGREVGTLSLDAKGGRLALIESTHLAPAEVAVLDPAEGGTPRVLTQHNAELLTSRWIGEPEDIHVPSGDGVSVHGWILKPPGFRSGERYPTILEIHGGPHGQYGYTFFHEMQHLAGLGYVVCWTNPRGSHGYGEEFAGAIVKGWGGVDYDDLMAVTDHLVAQDYVDETRLGVTGGSYGGYMTNWIIGHTNRFQAAVTQRSVVNLYSFFGESDFGFDFEYEFFGRPWENEETALQYLRMSPLHYVRNIETPLLIIHSEEDHRCPISQAEELFVALKVLKKPAEMVQFEGESHGLSRGGRPRNRLERLNRITGWFATHLQRTS